jgi:small subunit ribosomal protein S20
MPIIKSAVKRVKQAEKRRDRNVEVKRTLRSNSKALDAAIESGDTKNLDELLNKVYSSYDTAVKKNLIHKNKAARKKAHYSELVKNASTVKKATLKKTTKKPTAKKPVSK